MRPKCIREPLNFRVLVLGSSARKPRSDWYLKEFAPRFKGTPTVLGSECIWTDFRERIRRTTSSGRIFHQDAHSDEILNIAQRGILRTLLKLGPFRRSQLAIEFIQ